MTSFHVGQVVVCIDANRFPDLWSEFLRVPREGGVYTVRAVRIDGDEAGLLLHEIVNPVCEWLGGNVGEFAFLVRRFRPAKTTSLKMFEGMLAPTPLRMEPTL